LSEPADDRAYPQRPLLAASVACFRDGAVLLARRGRAPSRGVWSLPGGLVEIGESVADAAIRELMEETGVVAEISGFVEPVEYVRTDAFGRIERHVVILVHAARWAGGEPQASEEAEAVAWVRPDEVAALETTDRLAEIVARAAGMVA
jgi:ADP-ribose pyrophosphatase YjhB (NUDIX family)